MSGEDLDGSVVYAGNNNNVAAAYSTSNGRRLWRLQADGDGVLKDKKERERIDAFLDTEGFAERIRKGK